jgi:hypothetical protein
VKLWEDQEERIVEIPEADFKIIHKDNFEDFLI